MNPFLIGHHGTTKHQNTIYKQISGPKVHFSLPQTPVPSPLTWQEGKPEQQGGSFQEGA